MPVAGTGFVTLWAATQLSSSPQYREFATLMVCGAADVTAPVTGSFALAVSVSVASYDSAGVRVQHQSAIDLGSRQGDVIPPVRPTIEMRW